MSPYCKFALNAEMGNVHRLYHNQEYGFAIINDNSLFERLILEINQAGLGWTTILKKRDNFNKAFDDFDIAKVSDYSDDDFFRLMNDAGIIRNRLKIRATIENAQRIISLQKEFGSFKNWLDSHHPITKEQWVKLFKKTFKFTGGEIVNEFLTSSGYLEGAHSKDCPIYELSLKSSPAWFVKS